MNQAELLRRAANEALKRETRFAALATEIELQFRMKESPLIFLMASSHAAAVEALVNLATADARNVDNMTRLQGEVTRYREIANWLHQAVQAGREQLDKMEDGTLEAWAAMMTENAGP